MMTVAEITPLNNGMHFECKGHSGYAEKGADIVCAGISALCNALIKSLGEMNGENTVDFCDIYSSDGYLSVNVIFSDDILSRKKAETVFSTVLNGLEAIEEAYPDFLFIK